MVWSAFERFLSPFPVGETRKSFPPGHSTFGAAVLLARSPHRRPRHPGPPPNGHELGVSGSLA